MAHSPKPLPENSGLVSKGSQDVGLTWMRQKINTMRIPYPFPGSDKSNAAGGIPIGPIPGSGLVLP
jgi:hypothetical protein